VTLDPERCYRALRARDARFDGRFFTGVVSTGIYCRPVCPAPPPRIENCRFLPSAAAAQEAGFRPCLRCRPEAAPGTPAWQGTAATVTRALRLIESGALDDAGVGGLAARLGVGERHLRRLFQQHLGASPHGVARTRRALFAKQLLDETSLSMTQVAAAAGYTSVRRFNEAMRGAFHRTPSDLRRHLRGESGAGPLTLELSLPFRPPLAWDALMRFLGDRAIPGVEAVSPEGYRRGVQLGDAAGAVEVRRAAGASHLVARITLADTRPLLDVVGRLRRLFDLEADPVAIAAAFERDAALAPALARLPGVRVPGAWDGFELAVRAILGQQVSVQAATTLAARIAERHGTPLSEPVVRACPGLARLFPAPEALCEAPLEALGVISTRAAAIRALARVVARDELALDGSRDGGETRSALRAIPGIGEWTAEVVAMRALRDPDAFPATDLGVRRALAAAGADPTQAAEAWRPWRAYAVALLWMDAGGQGARATPPASAAPRRSRGTRPGAARARRATPPSARAAPCCSPTRRPDPRG
jgi:AraC family transcriptional regulator of adaptative response / DNA-3-methyladenine glycosylase II